MLQKMGYNNEGKDAEDAIRHLFKGYASFANKVTYVPKRVVKTKFQGQLVNTQWGPWEGIVLQKTP